jgi:endonuclease/exonuclease/phosphatase family metal-dependent hydrolase
LAWRQGDDWHSLRREIGRGNPFFVCGDFNQTRDGSNAYCSKGSQSILMLDEQLNRNHLICLTEENFGKSRKISPDPKKGYPRNNIDHICATKDVFKVTEIGAWDHFEDSGIFLSDHNGVYVDLAQQGGGTQSAR